MSPYVSIIIPTYNRARYLPSAIESVLAQTFTDFELIVVDDGSTDDTATAIRPFLRDRRVRYVYQDNQGRSAARNHGAALAQGDLLGFLDSDDRYLPTTLEAHLRAFDRSQDLGMSIGGYQYVDEGGHRLGERLPWMEGGELTLRDWLFNCYATPGSVCIRRSWFERAGGFDPKLEMAEDWDLFLRLARAGCPMAWVPEIVCEYRQHPDGSIHAITRHRDGALRALEKLFAPSDLPAAIACLERRAKAWVHVVFARKRYVTGQADAAAHDLIEAIRLDPELAHRRKTQLLEFLLSPSMDPNGRRDVSSAAILAHPPDGLRIKPGDIRRALARVEMARFFRAIRMGARDEAARRLWVGLRLDPTWLLNRGVLAFCAKQVLRKWSQSA